MSKHSTTDGPIDGFASAPSPRRADNRAQRFGSYVRGRRHYKGLTQDALADSCGVTGVHISQIERGRRFPAVALCVKLAAALECNPHELTRRAYTARAPELARVFLPSAGPQSSGPQAAPVSPYFQELQASLVELEQQWPQERYEELLKTLSRMVECATGTNASSTSERSTNTESHGTESVPSFSRQGQAHRRRRPTTQALGKSTRAKRVITRHKTPVAES